MELKGFSRVKRVYSFWFVVYLFLASLMLYFEIRFPKLLFGLMIIFLIKELHDFGLIKFPGKRVYWAEHAPLSFLMCLVGILDILGFPFFQGYVNLPTTFLAGINFISDTIKDLMEDPVDYGEQYSN